MQYISLIFLSLAAFFLVEWVLRATGLVIYRFFTAVLYGFYLLTLPIGIGLLLTHPHRWQLFQPFSHQLFVIVALSIGFYLYAIIRLIGFPNKRRNLSEIYHHVIFSIAMCVVLFIPRFSLIIFAWFYFQQIAIISYYVTYIFPISRKETRYRWYIIDTLVFFLSKIVLVVYLFIYTIIHWEVAKTQLAAYCLAVSLFSISLYFNVFWFLNKLPKALEFANTLKNRQT